MSYFSDNDDETVRESSPTEPVTTATASQQHKQEQELLSSYTVPNPPISTQQSSIANEKSQIYGQIDPPRTLWMGDLDPWLDDQGISDLWWQVMQKSVSVKIIKPKLLKSLASMSFNNSLTHLGYCFIEFDNFDDAQQALSLNGQLLPDIAMPLQKSYPNNPNNQKKYFRLNWASGATLSAPIIQTPEFSLFVGDLSASTTEAHLLTLFQENFPNSIKTVRVMTDPVSGKSRCFGFVRFTDESERQKALIEMNGVWFGGRPLRVALATPRNQNKLKFQNNNQNYYNQYQQQPYHQQHNQYFDPQQQYYDPQQQQNQNQNNIQQNFDNLQQPDFFLPPPPNRQYFYNNQGPNQQSQFDEYDDQTNSNSNNHQNHDQQLQGNRGQPFTDPSNTTVFVGGLSSDVTENTLFTLFKPFGTIQEVKIPPGKNCGFIKYSTREEAEEAISAAQGIVIGGNRVRLSWGKVSSNAKKYHHHHHHQHAAQQAQLQAAISMGLDPSSAIAAAAAAGYPPPLHGGIPLGLPPLPVGLPYQYGQPIYNEDQEGNKEFDEDQDPNDLAQSFDKLNIDDQQRQHQFYLSQNYGGQPLYNPGYVPGVHVVPDLQFQNQFPPQEEVNENDENTNEKLETSSDKSSSSTGEKASEK